MQQYAAPHVLQQQQQHFQQLPQPLQALPIGGAAAARVQVQPPPLLAPQVGGPAPPYRPYQHQPVQQPSIPLPQPLPRGPQPAAAAAATPTLAAAPFVPLFGLRGVSTFQGEPAPARYSE